MEKLQMVLHTRFTSLILLLLISCSDSNRATQSVPPTPIITYTPGEIVSDIDGRIQYYVGNTPVIITVPHDGEETPSTIPERNVGELKRAENTLGIAEYFYNSFIGNGATGLYPHIIINNINRSKLDPDTSPQIGAQNEYALSYFTRYHNYIQVAVDSTNTNFGVGILVNLSGHSNDDNDFIELGYLLSKNDLDGSDSLIDNMSYKSSLNAISNLSDSNFSEIVRGFDSIGKKMMDLNCCKPIYYTFDVTPSIQYPSPQSENYNSGGYTVSKYTSSVDSNISGVEFVTPFNGHRDNPYGYIALGRMLLESVDHLFFLSTGISLMGD